MLYHQRLLSCIFLLLCNACFGQTFCPTNIDFEQGNLSNWQFYTGVCCPISTNTLSGPLFNRHQLTSGNARDPYGNFPVIAPYAGLYSLKLGNSLNGAEAERARYTINVPAAPGNYILIYRYAVVFEDPNHASADQPRFVVSMTDAATGVGIPCSEITYVASSTLPGFTRSAMGISVYYKPWTVGTLDLTGYNGRTVYINFSSGDCKLSGHFGYGYVDMNCGLFEIEAVRCSGDPNATLNGPPGFMSYVWMTDNFLTTVATTQIVQVPVPATSKAYAVIVTPYAGFGCTDTFYTTVTSTPASSPINATASNDTSICRDAKAQLGVSAVGNGPFTYSWSPAANLSCIICDNPVSATTVSQAYVATVTDKFGCSDKDTVNVTVQGPVINAGKDTTVCSGREMQLNATVSAATSYRWFQGPGLSSTTILNPTFIPGTTFYYGLLATDGVCTDTDYVYINVTQTPVVDAGSDTILCVGGPFTLQASYTGGATAYSWSPANILSAPTLLNPVWNATGSQTFYLTVFNKSCSDTDTVSIVVAEPASFRVIPEEVTTCKGGRVSFLASGAVSYLWSPSTGLSDDKIPDPVLLVGETDLYTVSMVDFCGRDTQILIRINSLDFMNVTLSKSSDRDCRNDEVILTATGADEFLWQRTADMRGNGPGSVIVKPEEHTRYKVTGVSTNGCQDTASVLVERFGNGIAAPNAFSPNGDHVNDCYQLLMAATPLSYELKIFNRWGNLVFNSNNHTECWDGTYNGIPQPEGVYVYYYRITTGECGEIFTSGNITLIR
jgi:gliding motility-associated-like protein